MSAKAKVPLKICALLGSARNGRMVERLFRYIKPKLESRGHTVTCIDPLTCGMPLLTNPIQFYPDRSQAPEELRKMDDTIQEADCFVLLCGEYNRSVPPAMSNIIDYCRPRSYAFKTCAIICYSMGPGAGLTMVPQLRAKMVEMGAPPVPFTFNVGLIKNTLDENGVPAEDKVEQLEKKFGSMCLQLEYYAGALKTYKDAGNEPDWPGTMVSM